MNSVRSKVGGITVGCLCCALAMFAGGCTPPVDVAPVATVSKVQEPPPVVQDLLELQPDGKVLLLSRRKSFIEIVDKLCYKKRIGYTFSTDVPVEFFDISDNGRPRSFDNLGKAIAELVEETNRRKAPICYPNLCEEDIDAAALAESILSKRDPLSVQLASELRPALALFQRYARRSPEKDRLLIAQLRDPGSVESRLLGPGQGDLLHDLDAAVPPSDDRLVRARRELLATAARELLAKLNAFIEAPLGARPKLFRTYLSSSTVALLTESNGVETTDFSRQFNRALLEKLYADDIRVGLPLKFRSVGDGIEFYRDSDPFLDARVMQFKKVFLFNIDSNDAASKLQELYRGELVRGEKESAPDAGGVVVAIPAQNALVINAGAALQGKIGETLFALDAEYDTVLVETKVFEYDDSVTQKLGTALSFKKDIGGGQSIGLDTFLTEGINVATMPHLAYSLVDAERRLTLLSDLAAYGRDGNVHIIAEPRLVLKPGEKANIAMETVKFVLTNPSSTGSGDLREVPTGVTFDMVPTILSDGKILLDVTLSQSEFIPNNETNVTLATNKNTIKTKIIAENGQLVSLGGIKTRKASSFDSGIPYLKDIPGLGLLFGSQDNSINSVNIEFMIRPTIKYSRAVNQTVLENVSRFDQVEQLDIHREAGKQDLSAEMARSVTQAPPSSPAP